MTCGSFLAQATLRSYIASFGVDQYLVYVNTRCICFAVGLAIYLGLAGFHSLARPSYDWLLSVGVWDRSNDYEEKVFDPENIACMHGLNDFTRSAHSISFSVP